MEQVVKQAQPCGCDLAMDWHCEQYPRCQTHRGGEAMPGYMGTEHEAHLSRIKSRFTADLDAKYRAGQMEHGGRLWEKPGALENAIAEVIDLVAYLYTMLEQRDGHHTPTGRD